MADLTRITVNLTPRAAMALGRRVAAGRALHLTGPDGTPERLHLL